MRYSILTLALGVGEWLALSSTSSSRKEPRGQSVRRPCGPRAGLATVEKRELPQLGIIS